jgi:transposase
MSHQARGLPSKFAVVFPCGHKALLNVLNSVIDKPQYSHRLQDRVIDMLRLYEITLKRLNDI